MPLVVCEFGESAPRYVRNGWRRVFEAMGWRFKFWYKDRQSAHDLFYENPQIDIFLGTTYNCDDALVKCLLKRPDMKVGLFCSAWGELTGSLDKTQFPIDYVTDEEKQRIEFLKQRIDKPDFVFIHITEAFKERCIGGWREIGVTPIGVLNACDTFVYCNAKHDNALAADVSITSGYWPYKAKNLDKYIVRLANEHPVRYDIKVFGNSYWPVNQYLGFLPESKDANAFRSAKICPNISEPHSYIYPDIVERCFKVPGAGGFLISDNVDLTEAFPVNIVPQFSNYGEFINIIEYYIKNHDKRHELAKRQKEIVLDRHTYFDRVAKMFTEFNMEQEATNCLNLKRVLVGS